MDLTPLVSIQNIYKEFDISGGWMDQLRIANGRLRREKTFVHAVNGVSLEVGRGETVSVVGESGCGKSTLARVVIRIYPPERGEVHYRGERIDHLSEDRIKPYRTRMQMIFQDPYASLNPRMSVKQILEEPIRFHWQGFSNSEIEDRISEIMRQVGVDPEWRNRFPHEFSGGQRQRISIARSLAVDPEFIVADEPIAALDVSIQAQILNLLMELQEKRGLTYLFISHDLSIVRHISHRVAVMYLGTLCEVATIDRLFETPEHPYTRALLSAIPRLGEGGFNYERLKGDIPTPIHLPSGCVFHGRCRYADNRCREEIPILIESNNQSFVACHGVQERRIPS
jgi:peptide/nickel transport system ATP-binding protein